MAVEPTPSTGSTTRDLALRICHGLPYRESADGVYFEIGPFDRPELRGCDGVFSLRLDNYSVCLYFFNAQLVTCTHLEHACIISDRIRVVLNDIVSDLISDCDLTELPQAFVSLAARVFKCKPLQGVSNRTDMMRGAYCTPVRLELYRDSARSMFKPKNQPHPVSCVR